MTQAIVLEDLDWAADAMDALVRVAAEGKPFDAYTLTERAELRDPPHPNMWGKVFRQANDAGLIRPVGYHRSRPCHAAAIRTARTSGRRATADSPGGFTCPAFTGSPMG